jgi:hypothetical protein
MSLYVELLVAHLAPHYMKYPPSFVYTYFGSRFSCASEIRGQPQNAAFKQVVVLHFPGLVLDEHIQELFLVSEDTGYTRAPRRL